MSVCVFRIFETHPHTLSLILVTAFAGEVREVSIGCEMIRNPWGGCDAPARVWVLGAFGGDGGGGVGSVGLPTTALILFVTNCSRRHIAKMNMM